MGSPSLKGFEDVRTGMQPGKYLAPGIFSPPAGFKIAAVVVCFREATMLKRLPGPFFSFVLASLCLASLGCGSSRPFCGLACGPPPNPYLYATTTSNQILGFTISSEGKLTTIASTVGPANSQSIAATFGTLFFADSSSNEAVGESINLQSGALMPVQGSPFSLGSSSGGPNSIFLAGSGQYLYASEHNGTIVGYSYLLPAALPGSPYAAGVAPTQMAYAYLGNSGSALYASDPGDSSGGVLGFAIASDGSLSPIAGSPFATSANAGPSYLLNTANNAGQFLFVSLSNAGQIAGFSIDTATGALTPVPGSPFAAGKGPGILIAGPANTLFVINTVDHTVEAFSIASNGVLAPIGSPVAVGTASGGMAFREDTGVASSQLYTADTTASSIEIVNVDNSSGAISAGGTVSVSSPPLQLAVYDQFPLP